MVIVKQALENLVMASHAAINKMIVKEFMKSWTWLSHSFAN